MEMNNGFEKLWAVRLTQERYRLVTRDYRRIVTNPPYWFDTLVAVRVVTGSWTDSTAL